MKTIQKTFSSFALAFAFIAPLAACATAMPPKELVLARAEFKKASAGEAGQLDPAQLHVAKESLDLAEKSFEDTLMRLGRNTRPRIRHADFVVAVAARERNVDGALRC